MIDNEPGVRLEPKRGLSDRAESSRPRQQAMPKVMARRAAVPPIRDQEPRFVPHNRRQKR